MKQEIQARMDRAIANARLFNELFDLMVTTAETSFEVTSVCVSDNNFRINYDDGALDIDIICNDNEYNTITINITYNSSIVVGVMNVNVHGGMEESYHSVPRAYRLQIYDFADAVSEALDGFIDGGTSTDSNAG